MANDDDEIELPQKPLPSFSLRWLVGLITASALLFTLFRVAGAGLVWLQLVVLVFVITVISFIVYAIAFLLGILLNSLAPAERSKRFRRASTDRNRGAVLLLALLGMMGPANRLAAQVKVQGTFAPAGQRLDYLIDVSLTPSPGVGGYQQISLRFRPRGKAFVRDHLLTVSIVPRRDHGTRLSAETSKSFQLPQGGTGGWDFILVPNLGVTDRWNVRVSEDGRPVSRIPLRVFLGDDLYKFSGQYVTVGVLDPNGLNKRAVFPDLRVLPTVFGNGPFKKAPMPTDPSDHRLDDRTSRSFADTVQPSRVQFRRLLPKRPPESWLAIGDLDMLIADSISIGKWLKNEPTRDVLKRWVTSGGRLILYGDDNDTDAAVQALTRSGQWNAVTDAEFLAAKISTAGTRSRLHLNADNDRSPLRWEPWEGRFRKQQSGLIGNGPSGRLSIYNTMKRSGSPMVQQEGQKTLAEKLSTAPLGLGQLIRIREADPFPGSFDLWFVVSDLITPRGDDSLRWTKRQGFDPLTGTDSYWRSLIASVGGPPVKSFLTLNTLFAVLVGPLAYTFLRRVDRLYLLYFGAPALALLVTGSLFTWAMLSDGVATRLRTLQWTWLDTANHVSLHQERTTYYSAFGSDALRFPVDAMVTPILPNSIHGDYFRRKNNQSGEGQVRWSDDWQTWSGGFLPTRTQRQYQVTRPHLENASGLRFEVDSSSGGVRAINDLDFGIGPLFYRPLDGTTLYRIERLNRNESAPMQTSDRTELITHMAQRLPRAGYIPDLRTSTYFGPNSNANDPGVTSLLERRYRQWLGSLPAGSFIGVADVDRSRFAVDQPDVSDSIHLIMGTAP